MATLKPDDKPACAEYDPELWFPNPSVLRGKSETSKFFSEAITAMEICAECPLYANNTCLEYAMSDAVTINHGIYAATLPFERRLAAGIAPFEKAHETWQVKIRERAAKYGVKVPTIPQVKRPKSFHTDMMDMSFLLNNKKDKNKAEAPAQRDGDDPLIDLEKTA